MRQLLKVFVLVLVVCFAKAATVDSLPYFQKQNFGLSIGLGILSANAGDTYQGQVGSQGSLSGLYYLGRGHIIGLGIGTQLPALSSGMLHYPLFVQYQYFFKGRPSVKAGIKAGYSFSSVNVERNIYEAEGGIMVEPFVGIKINNSSEWAWNFELGLLHQQLRYQIGDIDVTGNQEEQDWKLWRFVFRTTIEL